VTLRTRVTGLVTVLLALVLAAAVVVLERLDARDTERRLEERVRELARPRRLQAAEAEVLAAEPDGSRVEIWLFRFQGGDEFSSIHLASSAGVVTEKEAGEAARLVAARHVPGADPHASALPVTRTTAGGVEWVVATDLWPAPPGRPDEPLGERGPGRRSPQIVSARAFLESGPAWDRHAEFVLRAALVGVGAVLLGGLLAFAFAARMLRPVARAASAAERLTSPHERLPGADAKDELGRLLAVLNDMLARLERTADREHRFLASASHELRRPLAALLGELELAATTGKDVGGLRAAIGVALEDGRGMSRLVDDLLDHARAQAGTLRLAKQETDLVEVLVGAVRASRRARPGSWRVEIGEIPPTVLMLDPDAMRRVFENLVVNAAIHGGDDVTVALAVDADTESVRVHVEDDGPGIPPDELPHVFETFGRGDRARSSHGLGLGLAIAKSIVEAHGGRLTVLSPRAPDGARPGSRFTVHLPPEEPSR
jgi:signal transduction histidine kinase